MAGMTTNRLIGMTRGKSKANGLGKPKERGNKPNVSTWHVSTPCLAASMLTTHHCDTHAHMWRRCVVPRVCDWNMS